MRLPQSFVLTDTIPNPIGMSTSSGVLRKVSSSIPRSKAPTSLMVVTKVVCQAPLFFAKTLVVSSFQPAAVFCMVATLCEIGGIPKVMVRSEDIFVPFAIPHPIFEANCMEVSKVQLESWHVAMAKFHDLPT